LRDLNQFNAVSSGHSSLDEARELELTSPPTNSSDSPNGIRWWDTSTSMFPVLQRHPTRPNENRRSILRRGRRLWAQLRLIGLR